MNDSFLIPVGDDQMEVSGTYEPYVEAVISTNDQSSPSEGGDFEIEEIILLKAAEQNRTIPVDVTGMIAELDSQMGGQIFEWIEDKAFAHFEGRDR